MDRYKDFDDQELLAEIDARGENLTPWEVELLEGLIRSANQRRRAGLPPMTLTTKQRKKLDDIAEERVP